MYHKRVYLPKFTHFIYAETEICSNRNFQFILFFSSNINEKIFSSIFLFLSEILKENVDKKGYTHGSSAVWFDLMKLYVHGLILC